MRHPRKLALSAFEASFGMLEFRLVSGSILDLEPLIRTVLKGVSLICYVVETAEAGPHEQFQREYLQTYRRLIRENTPADTPWIWILNKVDLGSTNPLKDQIPAGQLSEMIHTIAYKGVGIDVLWEKIMRLLAA